VDAITDATPGGWRRDEIEGTTVYVSDAPALKGITIIDAGTDSRRLTDHFRWQVYSGLKLSQPIDGDQLIIEGQLIRSARTLKDAAYLTIERACQVKWAEAWLIRVTSESDDGRFVVENESGTSGYRLLDKGNLVKVYASDSAARNAAIGIKMKEISDGDMK